MIDAKALWLVPGLEHPVYKRTTAFFAGLFRNFEALDYRAAYLNEGQAALERRVNTLVDRTKPDLMIYSQFPSSYSYITPGFLRDLCGQCRVVGLGYDDEMYFDQAKFFYQSCSAVITTDIAGTEWLKQAGIPAYLAQLVQPEVVEPAADPREDIEISFVGDMSKPGRQAYIRHLESCGLPVADFGIGSRRGAISEAEMLDVFRRSKISLNFTGINPPRWIKRHDPMRGRFGQIKARPFELAAMGKFCLCEWAPCVEYWFRTEVEIGVFRGPEHLEQQVRRYLHDDSLRRRVGAAARERYLQQWLPETQFTRLFSSILAAPAHPARGAPVPAAPLFYESVGRSRGVAFLHALRRASPIRAVREIFSRCSTRLDYWRGFVTAIADTVGNRLRQA